MALLCTIAATSRPIFCEIACPWDAGISTDELERLGDKADVELANRFAEPANAGLRRGLLQRMVVFGDLGHPSDAIRDQLISFVENDLLACTGKVYSDRVTTATEALEAIGARGGPKGLEYLQKWVTDEKTYGRIKCYYPDNDPAGVANRIRRSALHGIGDNGSKESLRYLEGLIERNQTFKFPRAVKWSLESAIEKNREILRVGYRIYFMKAKKDFVHLASSCHLK